MTKELLIYLKLHSVMELDLKTREITFIYNSSLQSGVLLEVLEFII